MSQEDLPPLSEVQHEVMSVVWDLGRCSASDVWKLLEERRGVSRNTVHTLLVRLEEKGWLTRDTENGNVMFSATVTRKSTQQQCVQRLINTVFDGSAEAVMLSLFDVAELDAEELANLRRLLNKKLSEATPLGKRS